MTDGYVLARYDKGTWERQIVTDHPQIPPVADELRRMVMGRIHKADEPICWWPRDIVWSTVTVLHKVARHDDATALAELLLWCDAQGHDFMWELSTPETRPVVAPVPAVDVQLPLLEVPGE